MAKVSANLKTKCIGLRVDQIEWYEKNDINFSKLIRRLVDNEIKRRDATESEKMMDDNVKLFDHLKDLVIKSNPRVNLNNITVGWLKVLINSSFPCLDNHYHLLSDEEKRILEAEGIDTGMFDEKDLFGDFEPEL